MIRCLLAILLLSIAGSLQAAEPWRPAPGLTAAHLAAKDAEFVGAQGVELRGGRKALTSWWRFKGVSYRCTDYFFGDTGPYNQRCDRRALAAG